MSRTQDLSVSHIKPGPEHPSVENVLVIQSAHPNRVLRALEQFRERPVFANPRYTLFCRNRPEILEFFKNYPMLAAIRGHSGVRAAWRNLRSLRREKYDAVVLFFAGEPGHGKIKWFAFLLGVRKKVVFNENNHCFQFTWKAAFSLMKHRMRGRWTASGPNWRSRMLALASLPFRLVFRRGRDVAHEHYPGERILVIQSAEPPGVLRALERLRQAPLFTNPRYTLFCRNRTEVLDQFRNHPMLYETRLHTETQNSWNHFRSLRRERFDGLVLFMTGDPGYWKIKLFALLLSARHKVIFNENNDCFYFTWKAWLGLVAHRLASRSKLPTQASWAAPVGVPVLFLIKLLILPFRFAWLLIVWLRLRGSAMKASS